MQSEIDRSTPRRWKVVTIHFDETSRKCVSAERRRQVFRMLFVESVLVPPANVLVALDKEHRGLVLDTEEQTLADRFWHGVSRGWTMRGMRVVYNASGHGPHMGIRGVNLVLERIGAQAWIPGTSPKQQEALARDLARTTALAQAETAA